MMLRSMFRVVFIFQTIYHVWLYGNDGLQDGWEIGHGRWLTRSDSFRSRCSRVRVGRALRRPQGDGCNQTIGELSSDTDILWFGEEPQRLNAPFAPDAALFHAAEGDP